MRSLLVSICISQMPTKPSNQFCPFSPISIGNGPLRGGKINRSLEQNHWLNCHYCMIYLYDQPSHKEEKAIRDLIGEPFNLKTRIKNRPVGSPRLIVNDYSPSLDKHFGQSVDRKFISIERREKGILIYIRNPKNNYVWPIPYYRLTIFKSTDSFNIHAEGYHVNIDLIPARKSVSKFLTKLMETRAEMLDMNQPI
jgi:hypothetical protein